MTIGSWPPKDQIRGYFAIASSTICQDLSYIGELDPLYILYKEEIVEYINDEDCEAVVPSNTGYILALGITRALCEASDDCIECSDNMFLKLSMSTEAKDSVSHACPA